jgi:DNA-binding Lrp family transcriptional regulator
MDLSKTDIAILKALQEGTEDGKLKLADRIGLSPTTLWRRVNELKQSGVIREQVTLLDPVRAGFPVCVFVFVNLKDYSRSTRLAFEAFVQSMPQIMECFSVTGANDYTMIVRCRSVADFEHFLMEDILSHPAVESASSQISLREHKYTTALPVG